MVTGAPLSEVAGAGGPGLRGLGGPGPDPAEAVREIRERARFDVGRIAEIEAVTRHDVIAFVSCVAENVGDAGKYLHLGLTSYDIVDTALSLLMRDALDIILKALDDLRSLLADQGQRVSETCR